MSKKKNVNDYLGYGFIWFFGVVEDNNDPLKTGRVKVRCIEWHTNNKQVLPTDDLPWAQVMMPVNSSSNSGVGQSPTGIQNGTWVVGFFMDGEKANRPLIMGTIPGIPLVGPNSKFGFNDPNEKYPKEDLLEQPDTNRLARNDEKFEHDIINAKNADRALGNQIANQGGSWDEPADAYNAQYPDNDVYEGKSNDGNLSGVIREYDNTPKNERIHFYHPSGSFAEYNALGNHHQRVVGDNYTIVAGKDFVYIKGDATLTIDGNCRTHIEGDWDVYVGGYKKEVIGGNLTQEIGEGMDVTTGKDVVVKAGGDMDLSGGRIDLNKDVGGLFGGLLGSMSGFMAGGLLDGLGGAMMESIGNMGGVLSSSLGDLGGLTGALGDVGGLAGGLSDVGGVSSLASGFSAGGALGGAFSGGLGGALSGASGILGGSVGGLGGIAGALGGGVGGITNALGSGIGNLGGFMTAGGLGDVLGGAGVLSQVGNITKGLDIVNNIQGAIPAAISFASGNINPGNFLGNITSGITSGLDLGSLTGNLGKTFSSITDFTDNLTSNFNIVNVLGEAGAGVLGSAVDNMFNPANALNGFTEDIFSGRSLTDVAQGLSGGILGVAQNAINKQFDVSVQEFFNAQSLMKSVVDPTFASLNITDKITQALELDTIVDKTIGAQQKFMDSIAGSQLLSADGFREQLSFELENRVFNSIRSTTTPDLIDGVTNSPVSLALLKQSTERVSPLDSAGGLFTNAKGVTSQVFQTGLSLNDGTPITADNIKDGIGEFLASARAADNNGA